MMSNPTFMSGKSHGQPVWHLAALRTAFSGRSPRRAFLQVRRIACDAAAAGRETMNPPPLRSSAMRLMATAVALFLSSAPLGAQVEIRSLTGTIEGHEVGGVTIDMIGNVYVADVGDIVWKVTPEGQRTAFVSGLYGTSGNAIDNQGNLLQASFYADAITRVDRNGQAQPLVTGQVSRRAICSVVRTASRS